MQSVLVTQPWKSAHAGQRLPPQSMSVSRPPFTPSPQLASEGLAVGELVGIAVGANDGAEVGDAVGVAVGVYVGTADGTNVGVGVGTKEGTIVGAAVGAYVGCAVGTGTGVFLAGAGGKDGTLGLPEQLSSADGG